MGALTVRGSALPRVFLDIIKFGVIAFVIVLMATLAKSKFEVVLSIPFSVLSAAGAVLGLLLVLRLMLVMTAGGKRESCGVAL